MSFCTTIRGCLRGTITELLGKVKFSVSCTVSYQNKKQVDKMKKLLFAKRIMDYDWQTIVFCNEQRGRLSMIRLRVK